MVYGRKEDQELPFGGKGEERSREGGRETRRSFPPPGTEQFGVMFTGGSEHPGIVGVGPEKGETEIV